MEKIKEQLENISNHLLETAEVKPNFSNRDFMNSVIVFHSAIMDKMYSMQESENMDQEDRLIMAENCGLELQKLIFTYTGLDTHKFEEFL